jgi:hypothetical protein
MTVSDWIFQKRTLYAQYAQIHGNHSTFILKAQLQVMQGFNIVLAPLLHPSIRAFLRSQMHGLPFLFLQKYSFNL